jgi:uncharacterized membrane-anchored protein
MTTDTASRSTGLRGRQMLNKVPEVTVWFWVIKILCTTVGESFADWINMTLGVGLTRTALISTAVFVVILALQFRLDRYDPIVYWLTVVVVSVTGTLYTDILTDNKGVPLRDSTAVFAALLAIVFAIWFVKERTLSIHAINTLPREAFFWLAVLVTFALGTATGDWTLELTGWSPGRSVLLPAALIAIVTLGWKLGADAVLAFWLAYILTRPLGANLGDWFASPKSEKGLGFGTAGTSWIYLGAIAATVAYLSVSRADVTPEGYVATPKPPTGPRQYAVLAGFAGVALATGLVLHHASTQPHANALDEEEEGSSAALAPVVPGQVVHHFAATDLAQFRTITADTLNLVNSGDQARATARIADLEKAWDDAESTLKPKDSTGWHAIDDRIDAALTAVRTGKPDPATEKQTLTDLLATIDAGDTASAAAPVAGPGTGTSASAPDASSGQSSGVPATKFSREQLATFVSITQDTLSLVSSADQAGAKARIKDLETSWDDAESMLRPKDPTGWSTIDDAIDAALSAVRASSPDAVREKAALTALLAVLG